MSENTQDTKPPAEKTGLEKLLESATEALNKERERRNKAKAAAKPVVEAVLAPVPDKVENIAEAVTATPAAPPAPPSPETEASREDRHLKYWLVKRVVNVLSLVFLIVTNFMVYAYVIRGDKMDADLIKGLFTTMKDLIGVLK